MLLAAITVHGESKSWRKNSLSCQGSITFDTLLKVWVIIWLGIRFWTGTNLLILLRLLTSSLAIPESEVLINSSSLGCVILRQHRHKTNLFLGRLAMHGFVESGITAVIFGLEFCGRHYKVMIKAMATEVR